jgi:hypothetical protein
MKEVHRIGSNRRGSRPQCRVTLGVQIIRNFGLGNLGFQKCYLKFLIPDILVPENSDLILMLLTVKKVNQD